MSKDLSKLQSQLTGLKEKCKLLNQEKSTLATEKLVMDKELKHLQKVNTDYQREV